MSLMPQIGYSFTGSPKAEPPKDSRPPLYMFFIQAINWDSVGILEQQIVLAYGNGHSEINLVISSLGGDVAAAITTYNQIVSLPVKITTYNLGDVQSSANILYLSGSERVCDPNAKFMFHHITVNVSGNIKNLSDTIESLKKDEERMKSIYDARMNLTQMRRDSLFTSENYISAREAVSLGLVTKIAPLQIPPGADLITIKS